MNYRHKYEEAEEEIKELKVENEMLQDFLYDMEEENKRLRTILDFLTLSKSHAES